MHITLTPIQDASSPQWSEWKEIYLSSFPENERMSDNFFEDVFSQKGLNEDNTITVLAVVDSEDPFAVLGIVVHEIVEEERYAFVWYLAVAEEYRSSGIGSGVYSQLLAQFKSRNCDCLLYEVEIPEEGDSTHSQARRRIKFYERQGARVLGGYHYMQSVDNGSDPIPMYIMIHLFRTLDFNEMFDACKSCFQSEFTPSGEPCFLSEY